MKKERAGRRRSKKKIVLTVVLSIFALLVFVVMPALTVMVYQENFGGRYETSGWMEYSVDDFDGLRVTECTFPSNDGQLLAGYRYSKDNQQVRGVLVIAHGFGGGGHNTYMSIADYFTSNGYLVFAYDATGNDKSEGESVKGLPQGVIDLDYALRYVKQDEEYENLPIVLFGHSWGGYCVGSVLSCHADVKAVAMVAGFDRSADLLEQEGESMIGPAIHLFMPYFSLYERWKFGAYASYGALEGFANSDADIMVIHSRDDTVVRPENGYDRFYSRYADDPRFCFVSYEDRGHNYVFCSEASRQCREQLNADYDACVEANGGEYSAELKTAFMEAHLDKSECFALDEELMGRILEFYDSACE